MGFWSKFIPGPGLYKFNSPRKVTRNEINYELDISCLMQWYVYWDLKAKEREKLYSLVKKDDIVFDVGTNIGETLLNISKLAGDKGYVYGFEPDDKNYSNVQKNISINSFANIHVFKQAVSDKKETVKLYCVEPHNRGMNRILQSGETTNDRFITLAATTIDDIVRENNIQRLNLIKIDIEGYEMHALRGAVETLKRFKPTLFIEVGYNRLIENKTSPKELIAFLEDLGYAAFHSETEERVTGNYDFSGLGDGSLDVYAFAGEKHG